MLGWLASAAALITVWFTRLLWRRYTEYRALARPEAEPQGAATLPSVSVIVPARNEEHNIRACLSALLAQRYSNFDIIVVDDSSTDSTQSIIQEMAADPRLRPVAAPPLPPGWLGKCHALWAGTRLARGEWLFFLDADTFAKPDMLAASVAYAEARNLDVISLIPGQDLQSLAEKIIQPTVFIPLFVLLPPARANDPDDSLGHVAGQCLGIRRAVYEAFGGHGHPAVRHAVSEDSALGQVVKTAGYRLEIVEGKGLARTRMYTTLSELWNGWTKNAQAGMGARWYLLPLAVLSMVVAALYFTAAFDAAARGSGPAWAAALNGLTLAYLLVFLGFLRWKVGLLFDQPVWYALTYPVGLAVVWAIGLVSFLGSVFGFGPTWKGRRLGLSKNG